MTNPNEAPGQKDNVGVTVSQGSADGAVVRTPSGHRVNTVGRAGDTGARVVVLVSGGGSNLQALLDAQAAGDYGARIVGVVTDNPEAGAIALAANANVACVVVNPKDFDSRDLWNKGLADAVAVFSPQLVVSAGFMRILGPIFLNRFGGKTINTHPALLPSFPGAHGVRDALAYGVRVTGCTLHVVDEGTDTGPIIAQAVVEVLDGDDQETLHERIKVVERALIVDWVDKLCRQGFTVAGRTVTLG